MDVRLARAEVAAFDGVVEQAVNRVAVVLVVLRGVDAALRGDRVRAARRVLEAEARDVVAELGERRGGGAAGEAAADDDHLVLALVRRVDELHLELRVRPLLFDRTRRGCVRRASSASTPSEHRGRRHHVADEQDDRDRRAELVGGILRMAPAERLQPRSTRRDRGAARAAGCRRGRSRRSAGCWNRDEHRSVVYGVDRVEVRLDDRS